MINQPITDCLSTNIMIYLHVTYLMKPLIVICN